MMKKHFALSFIALSAVFTSHHGDASPRCSGASNPAKDLVQQADANQWSSQKGTASYYGGRQNGRRSANGAIFDERLLTAAHPWLPFGTKVRVTLEETNRSVIVIITDRLCSRRRIVDLSVAAARQLGIIRRGLAEVTLAPA